LRALDASACLLRERRGACFPMSAPLDPASTIFVSAGSAGRKGAGPRFIASRIARGTPSIRGKPFYSVTFARNYKDKSGAWKTAGSFSGSDLLLLAKLADLAHTEAEELRRADGQADESAA